MSTQHTPGPWKVDPDTATATVRTAQGKSVARCYQGDNDARLIAACPDLLAALREVILRSEEDPELRFSVMLDKKALQVVKAAITKATQP